MTSLIDKKIAVRIKTTKKEIYAVSPANLIINPKENVDVMVVYFKNNDHDSEIGKHKFKFEAVLLENENIGNEDLDGIRKYFDNLAATKQKIQGTIIKKRVYHNKSNPNPIVKEVNKINNVSENFTTVKTVIEPTK